VNQSLQELASVTQSEEFLSRVHRNPPEFALTNVSLPFPTLPAAITDHVDVAPSTPTLLSDEMLPASTTVIVAEVNSPEECPQLVEHVPQPSPPGDLNAMTAPPAAQAAPPTLEANPTTALELADVDAADHSKASGLATQTGSDTAQVALSTTSVQAAQPAPPTVEGNLATSPVVADFNADVNEAEYCERFSTLVVDPCCPTPDKLLQFVKKAEQPNVSLDTGTTWEDAVQKVFYWCLEHGDEFILSGASEDRCNGTYRIASKHGDSVAYKNNTGALLYRAGCSWRVTLESLTCASLSTASWTCESLDGDGLWPAKSAWKTASGTACGITLKPQKHAAVRSLDNRRVRLVLRLIGHMQGGFCYPDCLIGAGLPLMKLPAFRGLIWEAKRKKLQVLF